MELYGRRYIEEIKLNTKYYDIRRNKIIRTH